MVNSILAIILYDDAENKIINKIRGVNKKNNMREYKNGRLNIIDWPFSSYLKYEMVVYEIRN